MAQALNVVIGFMLTTVVFAMIYKIMPRVCVQWRDVRVGAVVTTVLFTMGRLLIGNYIGKSGVASAFGAAGSLIVVFVWVCYSAQVFLTMRRILALPPETKMFVCHDYPPKDRAAAWETTVAEQRTKNIHVRDGVGEDEFVKTRKARDAMLEVPALILPSIQVDIRAGQLPPAEGDGVSHLKIPLNAFSQPKSGNEGRKSCATPLR